MKENPIRTIRIGERLTQFQFSKILGVNQAQLSSYETGGEPQFLRTFLGGYPISSKSIGIN